MDTLTLDSNVLRDWAWCEGKSPEVRYGNDRTKRQALMSHFQRLRQLREEGRCELGVTTQLFTDFGRRAGKLPEHIEAMIGPHITIAAPSISTLPMVFPLVFADKHEIEAILRDVFPHSQPEHKKYPRNQKDALQLYAHRVARRDYFITSDEDILDAHAILSSRWGIVAIALEQYNRKYPPS